MIGLGSDKNREILTTAGSSDAKHKYRKAALVQVWLNSSAPKSQNYKIRGKTNQSRCKDRYHRAAQLQKYKHKNTILKDATTYIQTNTFCKPLEFQHWLYSTLLHEQFTMAKIQIPGNNFTNRNNTKLLYFNCISIWLQEQGKSNIFHAVTPCPAFGEVGQK